MQPNPSLSKGPNFNLLNHQKEHVVFFNQAPINTSTRKLVIKTIGDGSLFTLPPPRKKDKTFFPIILHLTHNSQREIKPISQTSKIHKERINLPELSPLSVYLAILRVYKDINLKTKIQYHIQVWSGLTFHLQKPP